MWVCVGRYADMCRDLCTCSHVCGGQKAALAAVPQVLSALFLFFGTGLIGLGLTMQAGWGFGCF